MDLELSMFNPLSCNAPVQPNYFFTCLMPEILLVNEALQLIGVRIWGKRLCSNTIFMHLSRQVFHVMLLPCIKNAILMLNGSVATDMFIYSMFMVIT